MAWQNFDTVGAMPGYGGGWFGGGVGGAFAGGLAGSVLGDLLWPILTRTSFPRFVSQRTEDAVTTDGATPAAFNKSRTVKMGVILSRSLLP